MLGSAVVYSGLIVALVGVACLFRMRRRALKVIAIGIAVGVIGLALPAPESRVGRAETRLDEFAPVWQFNEVHSLRIHAPPERVYEAIQRVRADEIRLFRTLTWIRRGGQELPPSILNAGVDESILDVSTRSGFIYLAKDAPRELAVGTVIARPRGKREALTPELFLRDLPPGFTLASMNFVVRPDGEGSIVSTETRIYANSPAARRRFAAYWRAIYPGSAFIRILWLRAIERREISSSRA